MKASIVVGLQFGDEGKGSIVDYLCTRGGSNKTVVRFNGGGQAAHNVVTDDGLHHTFSQFGSGTLRGARTHLSRFMLIDPPAMMNEAAHLEEITGIDPFNRLTVDRDCVVVTPLHKQLNLWREAIRGKARHGSCGMGIGETMQHRLMFSDDAIRAADLFDKELLVDKIERIQRYSVREINLSPYPSHGFMRFHDTPMDARDFAKELYNIGRRINVVDGREHLASCHDLVFEGAQGVLLDEWYGFHPYTTWSTCTPQNAITLLDEIGWKGDIERIGVVRSYMTRHGAGPFPTEVDGLERELVDKHNGLGKYQGKFRVGHFDEVLVRYALEVCAKTQGGAIDSIALTHADKMWGDWLSCDGYSEDENGDKTVSRLDVKSDRKDLDYQERLVRVMDRCRPVYRVASSNGDGFAEELGSALGCPVSIISNGPTAVDKIVPAGGLV